MKDVLTTLESLQRPRLLIQAARIGAQDYRRASHLRRHLGPEPQPCSSQALIRLIGMEKELDSQRIADDAAYSPLRHVDILIAMMGEARLLRAARAPRLS